MRACHSAAPTYRANPLTRCDRIALPHIRTAQMKVRSDQALSVVDIDRPAG
jgi:hypothetical protein